MKEVPDDEINNRCVYLPQYAVVREDNETTKIRVVFDASCKCSNGISLNDELMIGPVLLEDMRMVRLLDSKDIHDHRILWCRNGSNTDDTNKIKDYRLKTVTFGTASAPCLAIKTLMKLADDNGGQRDPDKILNSPITRQKYIYNT